MSKRRDRDSGRERAPTKVSIKFDHFDHHSDKLAFKNMIKRPIRCIPFHDSLIQYGVIGEYTDCHRSVNTQILKDSDPG